MMKNNKFIAILLSVLLIGIWGTIAYKIFYGVESEDENKNEGTNSVTFGNTDSANYQYKDDVKDPFLLMPMVTKKVPEKVIEPKQIETIWIPPPYKLSGIITNNVKKVAVLESGDGVTFFLTEGDSLYGLRISKIDKKRVFYNYSNRTSHWEIEQ